MRQQPMNMLGATQRMKDKVPANVINDDEDLESMFNPPANDFYNKAARLSLWSKSDVDGFLIDGKSSD